MLANLSARKNHEQAIFNFHRLISLAGFAAQGTMPQFKVRAQYALNYGAAPE